MNINAVHDDLTNVIAKLEQQTCNDETKQDDEESKYSEEEIQELKSILSTCRS
jgi:predicted subunit of tRNA(5-methylaminomethyl-2-thiouridylate) methyltransferase